MEKQPKNELQEYRDLGREVIDRAEKKLGVEWVNWLTDKRDEFIGKLDKAGFKESKLEYLGYHALIGSTPEPEVSKIDFPAGLSVKEFYEGLLEELGP